MTLSLARDEMETHISQTAEDRQRGIWHVYTDDPYWMRRLDERGGKLVKVERSGGRHYEIAHRQITLRNVRNTDGLSPTPESDDSDGQSDMEPVLSLDDLPVVDSTEES